MKGIPTTPQHTDSHHCTSPSWRTRLLEVYEAVKLESELTFGGPTDSFLRWIECTSFYSKEEYHCQFINCNGICHCTLSERSSIHSEEIWVRCHLHSPYLKWEGPATSKDGRSAPSSIRKSMKMRPP